ncbi:MAG: cation-transporting P-type ATPase [Pseudonocardiales bacterium]|nr:cation-transporting P-type ATPase [Pseudonocardiales bacterium]
MSVPSTLSEPTVAPVTTRPLGSRVRGFMVLPEIRWAALATMLFALGGVAQLTGAPAFVWWPLYLACYAAGGWEPGLAGLTALRVKTLDVDLLMIVAALVAAGIGQVFDGALLIVIFATSGALEAVATKRTADSVRQLLDITPDEAVRLGADGSEEVIEAAELAVGDVVLVRPGERIPADGAVLGGTSEVDQATITGEPLPVLKELGDEVFAGTINGTGALRVRVNRDASEWVVARIVALVEEASATKAKTQLFIEKVEQRYSIGMVTVTLALFAVPLLVGADLSTTLLRAMTFMIVASPCAVVLATMPPLLSAIANAGRHGVLVKSAVVMEQLGLTDVVAFDKTGTLTQGTPRVAGIHVIDGSGISATELLAFAAAAERLSEHPLAAAIVSAARARGIGIGHAEDFSSTPGRGVRAVVGTRVVRVGAPTLLDNIDPDRSSRHAQRLVADAERSGATAVVVLIDDAPAGVLVLSDRLRPQARDTVAALTAITGRSPVLLTGDNAGAAQRLGGEVGITDIRARLLPHDKVTAVAELHAAGRHVLTVGDGINDSGMLAAADTGVSMGRHGSDLALETADAVLVRDDLTALSKVIQLSRQARRVVVANLIIAASVITALVAWDLLGHLPLPLGVAGHESSTVIVGLNGLRLLRKNAWRRAGSGRRS